MRRSPSCLAARWAALASVLGAFGCATTTTPLAPEGGKPTFEIECMHVGECWQEARRACRGPFRALRQRENRIPESELPGLNARTTRNAEAHDAVLFTHSDMVSAEGPGIESRDPLPITEVVVECLANG